MSTLSDTITYYQDLLLSQYAGKPKAIATIAALVNAALCDLVPFSVRDAFNLDTAVGPQLDAIGEFIGFSRQVAVEIVRNWFQFVDSTAPVTSEGFTDSTDATVNAGSTFYSAIYANQSFTSLSDEEYRYMLKFALIRNHSTFSTASISSMLETFFGSDVFFADGSDMTMTYFVPLTVGYFTTLAIKNNLLPKPMGVQIIGTFQLSDPTKIFAWADATGDIGNHGFSDATIGFNSYHLLSSLDKIS